MYQSQLATALNCSKDHISRVERGKNEYTLSQIKKLEQLTGVSIEHMLEIESPAKASWIREYSSLSAKQRDIFDNLAKQALKLAQ
ncbi:Lambda repressor-like protein [Oleispira antarctica RB-8]|uniref:Lambda repressor-like protein n=1 Tax=Oleispira antarctica RB-8 TaxID=698738 RepID=R4YPB3_OLEAN|nr:Lambda repressor-like protein [Oleispira antarctica RB-8]